MASGYRSRPAPWPASPDPPYSVTPPRYALAVPSPACHLALDDLLVVAPYSAQLSRIRSALAAAGSEGARVGTVDTFQGQEAPVAIYSLASSSAKDAPRGMDFLYALDRLNVATSRARVATMVFGSPTLLVAECRKPEQMRRVNGLVRFGELGGRG